MAPSDKKVPDVASSEVQPDDKAVNEGQAFANGQDLEKSDRHELGQLSAKVERLVADVSALSTKVETLQSQVTFVKGWIAAATVIIPIAFAAFVWLMNGKWDAIIAALHAAQK